MELAAIIGGLVGIFLTAGIFRFILGTQTIIANQQKIIKILETTYRLQGGKMSVLYPGLYIDKPVEKKEEITAVQ